MFSCFRTLEKNNVSESHSHSFGRNTNACFQQRKRLITLHWKSLAWLCCCLFKGPHVKKLCLAGSFVFHWNSVGTRYYRLYCYRLGGNYYYIPNSFHSLGAVLAALILWAFSCLITLRLRSGLKSAMSPYITKGRSSAPKSFHHGFSSLQAVV